MKEIEYWENFGIRKFEQGYQFLYFGLMFLVSIAFALFFKTVEKEPVKGNENLGRIVEMKASTKDIQISNEPNTNQEEKLEALVSY